MMARYLLRVCRWSQVTPVDQRGPGCQWLSVAEWPPYLSLPNWGITLNVTLLLYCIWYIYLYPYIYLYRWMHVLGTSGRKTSNEIAGHRYMKLSGWGMLIIIWFKKEDSWEKGALEAPARRSWMRRGRKHGDTDVLQSGDRKLKATLPDAKCIIWWWYSITPHSRQKLPKLN